MSVCLRDLPGRPDVLAALFCVYGLLAVLGIALLMPPFQAADELAQFERADQLSLGVLVATQTNDASSGGRIDRAIAEAGTIFDWLRFHPERKVARSMLESARSVRWSGQEEKSFPNTAIYPPFLYGPSAIGIATGRLLHWSIPDTLILARLISGLASVAVAACAIRYAGHAAPFLFTLLCLPMPLALFAATSQDGPMIALAAVGSAALLMSAKTGEEPSSRPCASAW